MIASPTQEELTHIDARMDPLCCIIRFKSIYRYRTTVILQTMLKACNVFCSGVVHAFSAAVCCTHPNEFVVNTVHATNLVIRLSLIVIGISIAEFYSLDINPDLPGIAVAEYDYAQWKTLRTNDWHDEQLPPMRVILASGNLSVVIIFSFVVITLFLNDLFRCGNITRNEWNPCDNQLDMYWYFILCISIPLLFSFTALVLGTHDLLMLLVIVVLTFLSGCAAASKDFMRVLINTERTNRMRGSVMRMLQVIHDLTLFLAVVIIILPMTYNLIHHFHEVSLVDFVTACSFVVLYFTILCTQHSYEHRCSILENRWPNERAVLTWNLPRQTEFTDEVIHKAEIVFPSSLNSIETYATSERVKDELSDVDPFNVETSEQLFDRIYHGGYIESASEHVRHLVLTPVGSFRSYTDQVGQMRRKTVGLQVEWSRYYAINLAINILLVLGLLNFTGFVPIGFITSGNL